MRATRWIWLNAVLMLPLLGGLSGCTQQRSWDDYASKTETMKFLTFEPCDTWFVSELPEHQMYFHVSGISPNADGSYRVEYQQQSEWVYETIYFRSVQYLGLRDFTAVPLVWVPSDTGAKCAALVLLPWSSVSRRPFAAPEKSLSRVAAEQNLFWSSAIDLCVLILLVLLFGCAMDSFAEVERDGQALFVLSSAAVVLLNTAVLFFNSFALSNIDAFTSFYAFYGALPKSDEHLLPLPWSQAHRLFDGPPYPSSLVIDDNLFWMVLCISCATWLAMYARRIFIGIAYTTMADPFDDLRTRLGAEGRVPTPEDYMSVVMQAGATMSAWQLELLKRRMKERVPDGGE
jgi:hypothetical protein